MTSFIGNPTRKPFLLYTPVEYSLTDGTDIPPPPPELPAYSPVDSEPPAPGGGPLTSHPATPFTEKEDTDYNMIPPTSRKRKDSVQSPTSPASAVQYPSSPPNRGRAGGVRRLFSLTNLRSSFNSSRTSLSLHRAQPDTNYAKGLKRPSSPSMASTKASTNDAPAGSRPPLRNKRSTGNWFKRKSGMFLMHDELEAVDESSRPETRESKRFKDNSYPSVFKENEPPRQYSPPPLLPEINSLGGARISDGDLGWDEQLFRKRS